MTIPENTFKTALKQRRPQIGLWQALANPYSAEICATAGFDWLLFDGEHAPNDLPLLLAQLQAVAAYPVHAVGRPPIGEVHLIKQYLDIGFRNLLVPLVETAEQAALLARAVRYPPAGIRGVGSALARASRWDRSGEYLAHADEQICLLVQVETKKGLDNLDAIAATEGVDGVFIGPADLSAALNHRGDSNHPDVQAAIAGGIETIKRRGKAPGILVGDPESARKFFDLGCLFVAVGADLIVLSKSVSDVLERTRQLIAPQNDR